MDPRDHDEMLTVAPGSVVPKFYEDYAQSILSTVSTGRRLDRETVPARCPRSTVLGPFVREHAHCTQVRANAVLEFHAMWAAKQTNPALQNVDITKAPPARSRHPPPGTRACAARRLLRRAPRLGRLPLSARRIGVPFRWGRFVPPTGRL